jgi:hypothetical protein
MTMATGCVLYLLEERVAGLKLCVVSSGRENSRLKLCVVSSGRQSSRFRTVCCIFWKRE